MLGMINKYLFDNNEKNIIIFVCKIIKSKSNSGRINFSRVHYIRE